MKRSSSGTQQAFWRAAVSDMRLDVLHATYTKVQESWGVEDEVSDVNRFYFICEGRGRVEVDGVSYDPQPGDLYWLPQGVRLSLGTLEGEPTYGKHWCHFRATVMNEPLFRMLGVPVFARIPEAERPALAASFERLAETLREEGLAAALRVRAEMLNIISVFLEHCGMAPAVRAKRDSALEKMNRVLSHIDAHLYEPVSVEELASLVHLHPNYFIRTFKRATGYSPIQYVNRQRMERAKSLLATTEMNVSEIAGRFGMELSYFSRLFKETTGFSPSQFRDMTTELGKAERAEENGGIAVRR